MSVVTGCNLGESLWRSRGTKHVKRICQSLGYDTHQSVDDTVREYLPENNADALPQRTSLYLGRYDEYYPIDLGLRAARAARAHNPSARVAVWPLGHFGTVLAFGVLNRLGLIRDTRK